MSAAFNSPLSNALAGRAEHISLEGESPESRAKPNPASPLEHYELSKGGRGVTTGVSILRDHYVQVETQRTGSMTDEFMVDLRFVDPRASGVRKLPWPFLYAAIGSTLLTAIGIVLYALMPNVAKSIGGLFTPIGLGALSVGLFVLSFYLTTETLSFESVHGKVPVIAIIGHVGMMRRAAPCVAQIAKQIKDARRQLNQSRQAYLRDEMREHTRLHGQGLLTDEQYTKARGRILQAHS